MGKYYNINGKVIYIKKNNHAASTAAWLSINSKVMTISFYSLRRYY